MFNNIFFSENRAVYEIMWKKYCGTGQAENGNILRRMPFAFRIPKVTNTYSECVILTVFPLQQWLH